ncbi:circadian clock KaiB family protein [Amorphus sp. MBR-141]
MSKHAPGPPSHDEGLSLTLFVGGDHPSSVRAGEALRSALEPHETLRDHLRVIDVFDEPRTALGAGVVATPSLLAADGERRLWMIGELEDRAELERFLRSFLDGVGRTIPPEPAGPGDALDAGK